MANLGAHFTFWTCHSALLTGPLATLLGMTYIMAALFLHQAITSADHT